MKHRHFILLLLTSLFISSCHKNETEKEQFERSLAGDYDWTNSTNSENGESGEPLINYTPEINGNNFGLKIKKSGKVFMYENGKLIKKGDIASVTTQSYGQYPYGPTTYYLVNIQFENQTLEFSSLYGFTNQNWPYSNCTNYFLDLSK